MAISISAEFSICRHWYVGNVGGILFQRMVSSIGILIHLMSLYLFRFVWCLIEWCIFCWSSMMSRLDKHLTCFWLSSIFASRIISFRNASCSDLEFFFIFSNILARLLMCSFIVVCWYIYRG